jgi:hypothetical protein
VNYRGSYRQLLNNATSAILAAVEIYNKPRISYRNECVVILLLNAWELLLKALLSKNGKSIFYPKERRKSYRTLSLTDALQRAQKDFPTSIPMLPVQRNVELLETYRNNAVHFYNAQNFGAVLYPLAQTSIVNFRDLLEGAFGVSLADEMNWNLLPLGLKAPIDPIEYISGKSVSGRGAAAVRQFLRELAVAKNEVEEAHADTGRLLTVFQIKLESTKKIGDADVVVGVKKDADLEGPLVVVKTQDPNVTHPLRQKDVVENIEGLHGRPFTTYTFQAIVWKHDLKSKKEFCWAATGGVLTRYSNDVITFIKRLTAADLEAILKDYRVHLSTTMSRKKKQTK